MRISKLILIASICCAFSSQASAIVRCELGGKSVNPNNGNETAGLTGMLRCKDEDSGKLQREQELRNGKNVGVERFFDRNGNIIKERTCCTMKRLTSVCKKWERVFIRMPLLQRCFIFDGTVFCFGRCEAKRKIYLLYYLTNFWRVNNSLRKKLYIYISFLWRCVFVSIFRWQRSIDRQGCISHHGNN